MNDLNRRVAEIIGYHERTKHRFDGYAKGPSTIDWEAQPDLFRRYDGCDEILLPLAADELRTTYAELDRQRQEPAEWTLHRIGQLLEISLGLSAWKQYGSSRWSLRCNPSSGNLHPTEAYLIVSGIAELEDGVYHYRADRHALELRCRFTTDRPATQATLLLGFSSVHWREAWKYGERAYRYCQLDVGHAVAAISFAAATLGECIQPLPHTDDTQTAQLLGIDRDKEFHPHEHEHPDLLLSLIPDTPSDLGPLIERALQGRWYGRANLLDAHHHYEWPVIDVVAESARRPAAIATPQHTFATLPPLPSIDTAETAAWLFRQRRSAQAFDGETALPATAFFRMLDRVLPRPGLAPWDSLPWTPRIHLVLFVHRVSGLAPGLYMLTRSDNAVAALRASTRSEFTWEEVADAPAHLPLRRLLGARAERTAARLSCLQEIAGASAFSLGMLAEFEPQLQEAPWRYRELYWEAGAIGQVLYLEAEAHGMRGTGIGCFFDDAVHELLGITDRHWQSLYHFTVGTPLVDQRIITLPPYSNER